jgi:hypothetical protein
MRKTDKHSLRPRNLRIVAERTTELPHAVALQEPFTTVVLVSCSKRKREHTCEARDLYDSDLFRLARAYAERTGDAWFILSARHHLTEPDRVTDPYDQSLQQADPEWRTSWANLTAHRLAEKITGPTRVVVLASALYCDQMIGFLRPKVPHPLEIAQPLRGLGIGRRMAWLRRGIDRIDAEEKALEEEEKALEEEARLAFNPDGHVHVALPSGGVAFVSPDISPETVEALDRMFACAVAAFEPPGDSYGPSPSRPCLREVIADVSLQDFSRSFLRGGLADSAADETAGDFDGPL